MSGDMCIPCRHARTVCVTHDAPWPGFDSGLMCSARVTARPRPGTVYAERDAYRDVLRDLIAELRRSAKGYLSPGAYAITVKEQLWLADWAEARLRDVSMSLSKGHDDE